MINEKEVYRLAAMGDVMLAREVGKHIKDKPEDFLFSDIKLVLKNYDLIFLNLENPVSTKGIPHHIQDPHVTFCCLPENLQVLKNLGASIVSLGNNHMLDYGETALCETLEHLNTLGIKHVGAGRNYKEANHPLIEEYNKKKVAFLSYVFIYSASTRRAKGNRPGVSDYRINKILPIIRDLSISGYQVIVSIHWGIEYSLYPLPYQMKQARLMIDNGASLILGHGPHYPQGIEHYKQGQIVYSLGNFIFDEPYRLANRSFIYGVGVSETSQLRDARIFPVHIKNHVPNLMQGREKRRFENLVNTLGDIYPRKKKVFWKKINNIYFSDIVSRVSRMRSLKFLFLPPTSFYFGIGIRNFVKKLNSNNFASIYESFRNIIISYIESTIRSILPFSLRKKIAIWVNRQAWLSARSYWSIGLIRDFQKIDPQAFHKFLWSHHFLGYAEWYDSEKLFGSNKMNGSELTSREFFKDLFSVINKIGFNPVRDIRSVLEVGCSLGHILHFVEKNVFPNSNQLIGVDIDGRAIEKGAHFLSTVGSRVRLINGDMEELDRIIDQGAFDFVYAAGVLSYLDEPAASNVVFAMLKHTNKVLALVGLCSKSLDNRELNHSVMSNDHNNQWIHNFDTMIENAGGNVIGRRWEGNREAKSQALYFVFATR